MPSRLSTETRWAIVVESKRAPQTDSAIAKLFSTNHQTVHNILKRYRETGDVADLPRVGRPRKLKEGVVSKMIHRNARSSSRVASKMLSRSTGPQVSYRTVQNQAKREGLVYRVRPKKPRLNKRDFVTRLDFANRAYPRGYWKRVVASDEHGITLDMDVRGEWVKEGESPSTRPTSKFRPGVKMWAGSSWEGKTPLYFIPKSMKGPEYLEFIKSKAEPDLLRLYPKRKKPPIWLQDKDGMHTAIIVQDYLAKSPLIPFSLWPSHSPDLNWQENVWNMLDQGVRKRRPTTIKGLKKVVKEEWEKIDIEKIRNCVRTMPERLASVIEAEGGHTKY